MPALLVLGALYLGSYEVQQSVSSMSRTGRMIIHRELSYTLLYDKRSMD